ncbi:hypothetical protein [Melaminivora sp.]|uniref:hypothetical protein n=1 Tax=Melaminivora sp. TaxID=1933032 RepID=UPI0028B1AE62|nr:hypothetical protein [Melaminivora sp.]
MDTLFPSINAPEAPAAPWGWSRQFRMPLYKPGTRVRRGGSWETVSHITLRRHDLWVHLVGCPEPVDPLELEIDSTVFTTERIGGAL